MSSGLRQSVITISGSLIASACAAIATIIITRQLGPEQYGTFSVGFALLLILVRINDWGMTTVIQKYASKSVHHEETNEIFSLTTKIRVISLTITIIIGLLSFQYIAQFIGFDNERIILLSFLLAGATGLYEHFQVMLQSLQRFTQAAVSNVFQAIFKLGIAVLVLTASVTSLQSIFFLYMLAPVLPYIFFYLWFPQWIKINIWKKYESQTKRISQLALHSSVAFITAGIIENIDVLFVQKQLSTYDAGLLGGISRVTILFSIIAYSLSNVLNSRVSRYTEKQHLSAYLKKALLVSGITMFGCLCLLPFSSFIITSTIGVSYLPGLPIMNLLLIASFLTIAVVPFSALFFSFDKAHYFSISGLLQLGIIVLGNILFLSSYGLEAAAWSRLLSRIVLFAFTLTYGLYVYRKMYAKAQ